MPNPPPPPPLEVLLAQAVDFAQFSLRARQGAAHAARRLCPEGPLFFVPTVLMDERTKDNFANTARLICAAHAATAAVLILEAWMTAAPPDGTLVLSFPPSESIHRKEIVMLTAETHAGVRRKIFADHPHEGRRLLRLRRV